VTQKAMFEALGAPLANTRWSWGAVRPDGTVVLRVWKDRVESLDGRQFVRIWKQPVGALASHDHGRRERLEHVNLLKAGARCFLIMCEAADPAEKPRRVRRFDDKQVYRGGALKQVGEDWWIELLPPMPLAAVAGQ
jgi:hypothetical protein